MFGDQSLELRCVLVEVAEGSRASRVIYYYVIKLLRNGGRKIIIFQNYLPYLPPSSSLKSSAFMERRWSEHLAAAAERAQATTATRTNRKLAMTDFMADGIFLFLRCECRF